MQFIILSWSNNPFGQTPTTKTKGVWNLRGPPEEFHSGLQPPRTESSSGTLFASPARVWKIRQFHISLGFYLLGKKKEAFGNTESTPLMAVTGCIWEQLSPLYWVQDIQSFSSICYTCYIYVSCSPLEVIKLETLVLICADILPSSTKIGCFSPSAS